MADRPRSLPPGRMRPGQPGLRRGTCGLLGICVVAGTTGPATLTGPDPPAGRPARAGHAWLTAIPADPGGAGAARQSIRFRQPDGTSAGAADTMIGTPVSLQATASSRLPVSFRSATPLVCTVSSTGPGTIATALAAGVCTITASQAGNAEFAAAPDRARAFQIGTGTKQQAVTFDPPGGTEPGQPEAKAGAHVTLIASVTRAAPAAVRSRAPAPEPGPAISFRSDTPAVCTVAGLAGPRAAGPATTVGEATAISAGLCTITATQPGDSSLAAAGMARTFQVGTGRTQQMITFQRPEGARAGVMAGIPVTLSASASSGLTVSFSSDTPLACAVSGTTVLTLAAGRCAITAAQEGGARFAAAPDEHRSFIIRAGPRSQSIQPPGAKGLPAAGRPQPVGLAMRVPVTATSQLAVTLLGATGPGAPFPPACSVSGLTVMTLAAGQCIITAAQDGSQTFGSATAQFSFTVGSKDGQQQAISGFSMPARAAVGVPFVVSAQASSGLAVSFRAGPAQAPAPPQAAAGLLEIDLIGLLVAGWRDVHDLAGAARRTLATPGGTELVNLASHQITVTRNPSVNVMVDNVRVARVQFGLSVVFDVSPLIAGVSAGLLTALHSGRCDITATRVVRAAPRGAGPRAS